MKRRPILIMTLRSILLIPAIINRNSYKRSEVDKVKTSVTLETRIADDPRLPRKGQGCWPSAVESLYSLSGLGFGV